MLRFCYDNDEAWDVPRFSCILGAYLEVVGAFEEATAALFAEEAFQQVEIVQQTVKYAGSSAEIRLMIDRPGGVDLALCGEIASRINAALRDHEDLYSLVVESAGLDRPLVKEDDYRRFAGRLVCLKTHELVEGAKTHRGTLVGLQSQEVVLTTDGKEHRFPLVAIKTANLEFDIREALRKGREREDGKSQPKSRKERRTS
jgi:ribosome maturation factor RimP